MKIRYEFTGVTNLEVALHDTLLEANGDLAECSVAIAAGADITFKPCQVSSPAQKAVDDGRPVEIDLSAFLCLLSRMVQMIDGDVVIRRSRTDHQVVLQLRVVDSSFALVETENRAILQAFESRLMGVRR
jgi:hypothetical protein